MKRTQMCHERKKRKKKEDPDVPEAGKHEEDDEALKLIQRLSIQGLH